MERWRERFEEGGALGQAGEARQRRGQHRGVCEAGTGAVLINLHPGPGPVRDTSLSSHGLSPLEVNLFLSLEQRRTITNTNSMQNKYSG